jgi:drug/metabolite transporter (DMT)-like permease
LYYECFVEQIDGRGGVVIRARGVLAVQEDAATVPAIVARDEQRQQPASLVGAYIAYAAICVLWGTTFLAIRVAVETMPPLVITAIRFVGAGVILCLIALFTRARFPGDAADWRRQAITGVLNVAIANAAVVWAEQYITSGLAALLAAMIPIWMAVLETLAGESRFTRWKVTGLLLGFAGVGLLVAPAIGQPDISLKFFLAVAAVQINCIAWNIGTLRSKRRPSSGSPIAVAAVQMLSGGTAVGVMALLTGGYRDLDWSARSFAAVLYLMIFGSIVAYSAFLYALSRISAGKLSSYAYINPVIAVIVGAIVLHEALTLRIIVAMFVILSGVAVIQLEKRRV